MSTIPSGFTQLKLRANPFVDPLGPLFGKKEGDTIVVALRIEPRHCNPGGTCHGGMLMTMADMLLLINANVQGNIARYMVTVNLTCDFVGPAVEGDWLEGRATVLRASKNMVFANGIMTVADNPVARVNGIFKPTGEENPAFGRHSYLAEASA